MAAVGEARRAHHRRGGLSRKVIASGHSLVVHAVEIGIGVGATEARWLREKMSPIARLPAAVSLKREASICAAS